jgi:His-Xaa-Ser system protein HxsD
MSGKDPGNPTGNEGLILEFDTALFSARAIKNAAYDFSRRAEAHIEMASENRVLIFLTPKPHGAGPADSLATDFKRHVLDHQVRLEINQEFKTIREMIVAQAFEPCENLSEVAAKLRL